MRPMYSWIQPARRIGPLGRVHELANGLAMVDELDNGVLLRLSFTVKYLERSQRVEGREFKSCQYPGQKGPKTDQHPQVIELPRADVNSLHTKRKPLDVLVEGLLLQKSRGDRTGFELFVEGIRVWTPETRFLLSVKRESPAAGNAVCDRRRTAPDDQHSVLVVVASVVGVLAALLLARPLAGRVDHGDELRRLFADVLLT